MKQFSNFEVFFLTLLLLIIGIASLSGCQKTKQLEFTVADHPWEPALGNHRAVLQIDNPSEIIRLKGGELRFGRLSEFSGGKLRELF